ncbi:diaminopimelate epimerase [Janthinobacterium sp. 61]|jgi:diaminopimelate epimerase|uniref:diaminopimelate epimerase n=1 Tax=Janthinobacterium sp. 61 TaxID=2035209 RepID=UPI000C711757|nr:diaminopimelate epimerase [Janthinobacterium sp. 61]PKV46867.1 diaminopimelate epimerase [Janthinobacterium sp. 61]
MKLQFTKMHGAGNDFIVIDAINQDIDFTPAQWQRLADRRFGIGADQILVVEKPRLPGCDFRYRIYNNDGGEVEQCGNGARAFVKFVSEKGLSSKTSIRVETMAGIIAPRLELDGSITVDMGAPVLEPKLVPFDAGGLDGVAEGNDTLWPLDLALPGHNTPVLVSVVSMGNPHAVQVVDDVDAQDLEQSGPRIEHHPRFPRRVNAGYLQVIDRHHVKLRVYERGAGETLACGTGACAAAVAGIMRGLLDSPVRISARGGELSIAWQGPGQPVLMTGPAVTVFEGTIEL